MNQTQRSFRNLVIDLLDDDGGINSNAYDALEAFAAENFPGVCTDIFRAAGCADGRIYLETESAEALR